MHDPRRAFVADPSRARASASVGVRWNREREPHAPTGLAGSIGLVGPFPGPGRGGLVARCRRSRAGRIR